MRDTEHASERLMAALDAALEHVRAGVDGGLTEHGVQRFMLEDFAGRGIEAEDPPIVAVNGHAGDPHYEPSATHDTPIRRGDFLLIDLWARLGPGKVYADSTWTAFLGDSPSAKQREVFEVVIAA